MRISSTHCDGKLEGCECLDWICVDTDGQRRTPKIVCPIRSFPSRTDLKGLGLQTSSSSIIYKLSLLPDPGTAPHGDKDEIIATRLIP